MASQGQQAAQVQGMGQMPCPTSIQLALRKAGKFLLFTPSDWKSREENTRPEHRLRPYFLRTMQNLHDPHS
jgi:hypothetical protein